ncbi:MAG: cation:proton antiporter, partial [Firmicutes bacterium]|nr:cation:proton antiporter [Bacillota bacterium]
MEIPLLRDIVIIFGLSIAVLLFFHRLRIPVILGFLLTGVLAGPHGFGLVEAVHQVELLAEIGVILLLFTIGLEFSLEHLVQIKRSVLVGGTLQVLLTFAAGVGASLLYGLALRASIFVGFLVTLSSTAIVLKLLQERGEVDSPQGKVTLGVLIFQDIIVVPMMLFTPVLAGAGGGAGASLLELFGKGLAIIAIVLAGARWLVPQLLFLIAETRNRELFLLSVLAICFAVAWLTSSVGLSLALGAFLAGLIISESEYSHQAIGHILPFRDIFSSFFFISIGMLLDVNYVVSQPFLVIALAVGVIVVKGLLAAVSALALSYPLRTGFLVGTSLAQVGEFSFVLAATGLAYGLLTDDTYQLFLAVSVLTMAATPYIIAAGPGISEALSRLPVLQSWKGRGKVLEKKQPAKRDHLIIVGYGINGRNLARAARSSGIPYVIIEINAQTVKAEKAKGEPIFFGDATQETILDHADVRQARVLVLAISDPVATRRIIELARRLNPKLHIIARTRFIQEMKPLYELGADQVIPEEFETSVEIFTRVLRKYLVPEDEIEKFVAQVRADGYEMFRELAGPRVTMADLHFNLTDEITTLRVQEGSKLVGQTLRQIDLRNRYGLTLLAVKR